MPFRFGPVLFFAVILSALLSFATAATAAPVSSQVPLDSWVYPVLDKLSGLGLVNSSLAGTRPLTRLEAARQIQEAISSSRAGETPVAAQDLLKRLENELSDALDEVQRRSAVSGYIKPRELQVNYIYQDGDESEIAGGGVEASQFPLNTNNNGIDYQEQNAQVVLAGEARFGESLLISVRPMFLLSDGDDSDADVHLLEGRAALGLGPFEFSVGRQALWWGQGHHGSLVLTNNAEPLDMIRVTNPSPILFPWVFKYLGPFRFDLFWSRLEEDRDVPKPYFAGLRFNFKPLPWFEFGASRGVMFGGKGRPDVSWDEFITIIGGENLSGDKDTSNSVAALDGRIRLPFLWNIEIYGEYGGEDEAGYFPSKTGYIVGGYLPQIEPSGRLSLRFEYADLNKSTWYRHSQYRSGYTYEGKIMGHHIGGAAEDTYVELQAILSEKLLMTIGFDYEERGFDQSITEEHTQGTVSLSWDVTDHYSLDCSFGYGKVENYNYIAGNNEDLSLLSVGIRGHW